ncbi:MAG: class I SAM-dependent methyltransferase [Flavisolibacter sp.]|nr:class I SAM-dependent methyltransferase [Flavisolibacter sp.]
MENNFTASPLKIIEKGEKKIYSFNIEPQGNIDLTTVSSFGEEWQKFDSFSEKEIAQIGDDYFDIVSDELYAGKSVLDMGCGTGRWTKYVARKAGFVEAMDPSDAVFSAAYLLAENKNIRISKASVDQIPFPDNSFDLVFSLGVLHHIPDTEAAMKKCVYKVKPGGHFLVYLYYNLDNRGAVFKLIFHLSNLLRRCICRLPSLLKKLVCDILAILIYLPFVAVTRLLRFLGLEKLSSKVPLSWYADKTFRVIRNDSLDRFGTPLEQRFSRKQISDMMTNCGLYNIVFSDKEPFWHALGQKR